MTNKSINKNERVTIVLPNKLGDSILSLPFMLCLRDLAAKFGPPGNVTEFFTYSPLVEVFEAVGITNVSQMNITAKMMSWLKPPDKAFFLVATSKNFGFYARSTYGLRQKNKWLVRLDHDLKCLKGEQLPVDLEQYLATECQLSRFSVRLFGVLLELGYSAEQIISTFTFSRKSLPVDYSGLTAERPVTGTYLVCCMEAACNRGRHNDQRRWVTDHYLTLANRVREQYGYGIAFVGIATDPPIPEESGFTDLRGRLSLWQLFNLMAGAAGYFGNDTGPLHMANLAGISSVGVYPAENDYAPLFSELNRAVIRPACPDDVYPAIRQMIETRSH